MEIPAQPWMLFFSGSTSFSGQKYRHIGETNLESFDSGTDEVVSRQEFVREMKRVNRIAWPMIVVSMSQFLLRLSPMFVLGHLGGLSMSSASIATTFCNVTGFSVIFGMATALETLCGQAYGAKQYKQVGNFTLGAILCLFLICIRISILWICTEKILIFAGQDPFISSEAGKYAIYFIPAIFPHAVLQSLTRYLQSQSLIHPVLLTSLGALFINVPICWFLVFKLRIGNNGAALSIGLSYWFNVLLLGFYVKYSSACKKTCPSFSREAFVSLWEFFRYALHSAMMVCLEWWSFELVIFLSGTLPNPQLEMNVLSICMTITWLHFNIPYAFGASASTRISNELGAGNAHAARVIVCTVLILSAVEYLAATTTIFMCRHVLGYAFVKEKEVVVYIEEMAPLLCLSIVLDSMQAVLSGVARGGGWQRIGAYVNLGAYYVVGIPMSSVMGFVIHMKGEGLWIGLVMGAAVQCFLFSFVTCLTDWEKQAMETREDISGDNSSTIGAYLMYFLMTGNLSM